MAHKASLTVIFLTVFIDLLGFGMVLPLLPLYADQFAQDLGLAKEDPLVGLTIGLLMASFSLMQFVFAPLWGRLSDRIGRRPVLMVGLTGSVISYALFGVATVLESLPLLFATRVGAGIAGATISTAQAYIADATGLEKRAKGMALIGAAFGLGFTFGPLFGYLALIASPQELGPGPGYAASALSALALALAYFKLPESLDPSNAAKPRHWFDTSSLRDALATPSIPLLLLTSFFCVFSFANFESTLSLLLKSRLDFDTRSICLVFAYIGVVLTIVQGGIVRRLADRIPEMAMAGIGTLLEIVGFGLMAIAGLTDHLGATLGAMAVIVSGFAFITPSLNSLISRRTDPAKQGGIMGVLQSVSALARILGPPVGLPLLKMNSNYPLWLAGGLMSLGLILVLIAGRTGHDFVPTVERD